MSKDPFTTAENDCICKLSWQSWDWLTHVLATGTAEQLVIVREAVSNYVQLSVAYSLLIPASKNK